MMNPVFDADINDAMAWTSASIGGKAGLEYRLGDAERSELQALLASTDASAPTAVRRDAFTAPAIERFMANVRNEIMHGKGAVIISGLDTNALDLETFQRIYWGLGTHLGTGAPQSYRNDLIGFVQKEEHNPTGRGYLMDIELGSHADFHEILSLAGWQRAERGGVSGLVSALAIHNIMREEHPEHLTALYEGYYHSGRPQQPVTSDKIPCYANVNGTVSCFYHPMLPMVAARQRGEELPAPLKAAMGCFAAISRRPDVRAEFMLERGEMMFWHNFVVLHSRTAFEDSPAHKRLLLRLWIDVADGRAMPASFTEQARLMNIAHARGETGLDYGDLFTPAAGATASEVARQ
ncbi:MAG: TauD/TfdA family dioxygenase [Gammaproteobacteria bacterium]|nr:TauD/TfdA family dioxygenase [Gammaproteobacteria bacterium]